MSDFSPEAGLSALTAVEAVDCPYCSERIDLVIDLSALEQTYVEDCHVCCRPIVVSYFSEDGTAVSWLSVCTENE